MNPRSSISRIYANQGFVVGPRLFNEAEVARLRYACEQILGGEFDGPSTRHFSVEASQPGALRRAFNPSSVDPTLRDAMFDERIGALAAQLLRVDAVRLWYSQIIEKPPAAGSEAPDIANIGWHQDYRYWQCCEHSNLVTAWISLQHTSQGNGAMRFVVGSHKWGLLSATKGFSVRSLDELGRELRSHVPHREWNEAVSNLRPGQVSFHHALLLHASGPNRSSKPRIGIAVHLMPATTRRRKATACHDSLTFLEPLPAPNKVFALPQWPVIWPPPRAGISFDRRAHINQSVLSG